MSESVTEESALSPDEVNLEDEEPILALARVTTEIIENRDVVQDLESISNAIRPGGHVFIVIPQVLRGEFSTYPFRIVSRLEDSGLRFQEDIVWHKGQEETPEYIFVFKVPSDTKKRNNIYWDRTEEEKERNEIDLSDYQGEKSKNIWKIPDSSSSSVPEKLASRIFEFYSYKGDAVLDVYENNGSIQSVAEQMGREYSSVL